ncbi:MAG: hypothetical protein B5M53_11375 [Candidatus Cloacimonas sp. 4484_209]|nr:MAG: hypothetical protein B5M53_11375 [Candidatus Cloacimonas sp. 4484_209]
MLDIDKNNVALRRKLISYYKHIYSNCDMIDDILEKANILRTDDIDKAIELLGRLMNLCPGKYVYHKTWGVGKIQSIDILFNKVFIDFPSYSGHAMSFDMAFDVLTPLEEDDFLVVKREKRDLLLTLKSENPAAIIKLMLNKKEELYENEVRKMLTDIIKDNEWKSFIEGVKKTAKSEGFQVKRKGNRYVFSILTHETKKELTIEEIEGISDIKKRLKALVSFTKQKLTEEERKQWIGIIENTIKDKEIHLEDKVEILFIKYDYTKDKEELDKRLSVLLEGKDLDAKQKIINNLSQKRYKKELFYFVVSEDEMFAEEVFLKTSDDWLRGYAEKILQEKNGLSNIWMKILQNPHQYSSSLLYLIDHAMKKGKKIEFAKRSVILFESLINLMSTENTGQKVRSKAKAIFLKYGFDLFRTLLETASQEEVKILLDIVKKSAIIDSGDKRAFESLANARYPGLKEKDDGRVFYVTKAAIKKKEKELDHLLKVEIPANSEAIGKAARQGDLSENFDYISAKEKQRKLIDRVNILKAELSKARPIEEVPYIEGEVGIGTRVVIEDVEGGEKREIVILGPWDSIPGKEVISHTAPFAGEVIGKKAGETFFDTYRKKNYRIASVEKCKKKGYKTAMLYKLRVEKSRN